MQTEGAPCIDSRAAFAAALLWGFAQACEGGARRIVCVDPDFAAWPLDDAALLERLTAWLQRPQRRLVLLAAGYDNVARCQPRFVAWRRHWAHAVAAWQAPEDLCPTLPTLLLDDDALLVWLVERMHWRGRALLDARESRPHRDEIDAVLQRSTPAFAITTLGL
ncbi:MAG: hypothetical protein AMXMBFR66_27540 [Pseudomonadota bacterium]|nr:hypothetical protein [Rubrivivax sp.]